MRHINRIGILLIIFIFAAIVYLFFATQKVENALSHNLERLFIKQAEEFAVNIEEIIKQNVGKDPFKSLSKDKELRERLQDALSILINSSYKYIYVLYRDKKGRFRYLLDGSKSDRGEFGQKLDVEKAAWNKVYETKKENIILHKNLEGLWITYLKPLIYNDKVEAVIAIDFSTDLPQNIYNTTKPIKNIFTYIFAAIGILVLLLLYQTVLNIITKKESITDALTSLYNRTYLREFLKNIDPSKYHILMIDIDHFKKVNDNYGHKAGDFILREVAHIIKQLVRKDDRIVRFGGEEFLIFLEQNDREEFALKIAQRIKQTIENTRFIYNNAEINITLSIGICLKPERFKNINNAIKAADSMLYIAKKEGRNKIVLYSQREIQEATCGQFEISEVQEALDENRILCHYQPIFDINKNRIVKYEALVRMIDKKGKLIYPSMFLEHIVQTNVYYALTKRVLNTVFHTIKEKRVSISVNLSFSDISDNVIYNMILEEIEKHKALSHWLVIELLENEDIKEDIIRERLIRLKSFNVRIAIDDFGSGFSNFAIFKTLPIDILKLDGSLIQEIDKSKISYSITKSIALFAKELNIKTVAEFVHNKRILEIIRELGIQEGQGFYLGKPSNKIQ
ncbi:EAL domain-containing protein [Nitrosophilus alvini]|uniref:EAL domain-containing protein n=1 Tax=Nitrosophilus alvini TaxID=2714855 RepID=UPI00190A813D|nr:EAL domain-containing protein [Nitrosophilus alvini]